ncbi:MAG: prolipoprotein diacylglyceryl transferase, partial [Endomicrobia bacterium]|nr:prolipoprotein diacylglyceryl transferase [Endomicrobiia bacterium]
MFPVLFRIGGITLRSYGLFVAVGVLLGYNYVRYQGVIHKNFELKFLSNFLFYTIIAGFIGGRLFYVLLNLDYYKTHIISVLKIWEGGLVFYGGFIAGLVFGIFYALVHKKNILTLMDVVTPGLYLGLSVGRIGCFFAGCCYGRQTESFLGVVFTHYESLAPIGVKIFPTQLFESIYSLIIFLFTHFLVVKNKLKNKIFFLGGILYSLFRFINEF